MMVRYCFVMAWCRGVQNSDKHITLGYKSERVRAFDKEVGFSECHWLNQDGWDNLKLIDFHKSAALVCAEKSTLGAQKEECTRTGCEQSSKKAKRNHVYLSVSTLHSSDFSLLPSGSSSPSTLSTQTQAQAQAQGCVVSRANTNKQYAGKPSTEQLPLAPTFVCRAFLTVIGRTFPRKSRAHHLYPFERTI